MNDKSVAIGVRPAEGRLKDRFVFERQEQKTIGDKYRNLKKCVGRSSWRKDFYFRRFSQSGRMG